MEPLQNNLPWNDLKPRLLSAGVLAFIALLCTWMGGVAFGALVILVALLMMKEWEALTARQILALRLAGYPYIIIPSACIIWLRNLTAPSGNIGLMLIVAFIAVITATDTGAYFIGRRFGQHKLAPSISPGKTWEGLGGGLLAAAVTGLVFSPYVHVPHSGSSVVFVSFLMALLAQAGDLFKSRLKRLAGVKDSGTLIPGHGGLIDRLDGYMFTIPVLALMVQAALTA